jgi:phenylalanyl-tRNA synthetase beta chain
MGTLKPLKVPAIEGGFDCPVEIRTEDAEGCPAFFGRVVRGLKNGPSPDWLKQRLKSAGQRPISALVDHHQLYHARPWPAGACLRPQGIERALSPLAAPATARRCWH